MPGGPTIAFFMASALALNLTPGPAILFILSRAMGEGRGAAIVSVFGLATASLVQAGAAALGLSALLLASPLAFALLRYCGAAYLIWLGVRGFLAGGIAGLADGMARRRGGSLLCAYWQGFLTDLLNPKLLLFFFSFLPLFVDPSRGPAGRQMLFLGLLFQVTGVPTNLAVACAGGSLARLIARSRFWARAQSLLASAILIGLGLRLVLGERR
ncbi:MAG TPA: LysE family translocator [Stellaceae bacterium]|nr:LysE family translocator [Stellaceae bacterium]